MRRFRLSDSFYCLMFLTASAVRAEGPASDPASTRVRPILARCVVCHNAEEASGDLDLSTRESALKGGESGPALTPGKPAESRLFKLVRSRKMPPKKPLSAEETTTIEAWIKDGAAWNGPIVATTEPAADSPRWAFRPILSGETPKVLDTAWPLDVIDAFVLSVLETKGLKPSPPADRRTWIRRVCFDLLGLPPSPEEVEAFVVDNRPDAHARLVDRLLASPRYGEHWARHWLDLARFAESHGFEYDRLRDNAWRYRDYVVKSLNVDKPYAQFVREQIAGDLLEPVTPESIAATGFLVGGPWDQAGSGQANLIGRGKIREEELEDMVATVSQTFLGLTVQCARCHNHKYDPIPQRDYYRMKAAIEGVGHGDRAAMSEPVKFGREARRKLLAVQLAKLESELVAIDRSGREKVNARQPLRDNPGRSKPIARWTFENGDAVDDLGSLRATLVGEARIGRGRLLLLGRNAFARTEPLPFELKAKTLEVWATLGDLTKRGGGLVSVEPVDGVGGFDAIVYAEMQPGRWMAGSDLFRRTKDVGGPIEEAGPGELVHIAVAYDRGGWIRIYRNGIPYGQPYRFDNSEGALHPFPADTSRLLFGLRHTGAGNGFFEGEIEEIRVYDRALSAEEVGKSHGAGPLRISDKALDEVCEGSNREHRRDLVARLARVRLELSEVSEIPFVYAALPFHPAPTKVLARGDFESPGETVSAGGLSALPTPSADFGLTPESPEGERRKRLANWIADPSNPLTARVLVNRLWHYHFGSGLVATPSDFGANGGRPSHPELLDRLAADFLDGGGTLKPLHRRIVLSNAYRQASTFNPKSANVDPDARLLWRFPPRRIEGEAVLDAMIAVTGRLNPSIGGPSFRPFVVTVFNSNFYNLTDPDGDDFRRRMIYRIQVHSAKSPLMEGLDCPDPSVKTPKRSSTVTPLQALALMNDSFVERQAAKLAERTKLEAGSDPARQVDRAYRLALGRPPRSDEASAAVALVQAHGLGRLTWALLNANEFLYLR